MLWAKYCEIREVAEEVETQCYPLKLSLSKSSSFCGQVLFFRSFLYPPGLYILRVQTLSNLRLQGVRLLV